MLVYIQPIFAPDEKQLNKNLASIDSLISYLETYPYSLKFITGGWCASDEYWKQIENKICKLPTTVEVIIKKFDQNYGKAYVVNTMFTQHVSNLPIDYFLTADSDMRFDVTCKNIFPNLLALASVIEQHFEKEIGMLSLQQHQGCCHIINDNWKETNLLNFKLLQPETTYGLAGGAMLVSKKAWIKIGGYRVINVYGGNDGWYLNDCAMHDCWYGLVDNIYMIHPFENDEKYALWKKQQIETRLNNGTKIDFEELKNRAIDSIKIWQQE